MPYNQQKHHRRSIRLQGYDYAASGAYFVTICTQNRLGLLGDIFDDEMELNEFGEIAQKYWQWLGEQYPYVVVAEHAIMPNHLHGILFITDGETGADGSSVETVAVGASRETPLQKRKPLGQLIGAFETVSTKNINILRGTPGAKFWQRDFYDRIIRDEDELNRIRQYIIDNPANWKQDQDNPDNV